MAYEVLLLPQFIAAGLMLLLAGGLLWIEFRSAAHRAFALFLFLRAMAIVSNQMPRVLGPATFDYWFAVGQYFALGVPLALAYFVLVYAWRRPSPGLRIARSLLLVIALAVEFAYALDHTLSLTRAPDGRFLVGPLWLLETATPLAFGVVGGLLAFDSARRPPGPRRDATFLASIAFALSAIVEGTLPLAAVVHRGFAGWASGLVSSPGMAIVFPIYWLSHLLSLVMAFAALTFYLREAKRDSSRRTAVGLVVGLSLLAPLTSFYAEYGAPFLNQREPAAVAGAPGPGDFLLFTILGLWRLLIPGLVAYALVKYRLYGVDLKLKTGLRQGSLAAAFGGVYLAAFTVLTIVGLGLLPSFLWAFVPMLSLGFAAAPLRRAAGRAAHVLLPDVEPTPHYLARRKMQIYVAAVEEAQARGPAAAEETFLRVLRKRLGISAREHRSILLVLSAGQRFQRPERLELGPRFRVERELGRGSHSRALLAHDSVLDRKVVLKQPLVPWMLDGAGRQLFLGEARMAARVRHPNVVTIYEVLPDQEPPTLVLEYVGGGSLREVLRKGALPVAEGVRTVLDILAGLEAIHGGGILHRDLKPANILLAADGLAKVTDFGVARPPDALQATLPLVMGQQAGSIAYMSPEQARGASMDERSDLYSVGCILYEVLTGRHYLGLRSESEERALQMVQSAHPRLHRPEIPASLRPILERALAKNPRRRFANAPGMAHELRRALTGEHRKLAAATSASGRGLLARSPFTGRSVSQRRASEPAPWAGEPRHGSKYRRTRAGVEHHPKGFSHAAG